MTRQPLAGLKVLDFSWVVAGPLITRSLADYGAEVVRIDSSRRVETARVMGPFPDGVFDPQQCILYENCNAGKLGLALDLRKDAAREVTKDLTRWADVVIESFAPGQMARWGLGYDVLSSLNPGLIMVSTSLLGQSGPYSAYSGYGTHGAAVAGFQAVAGPEEGDPTGPFGPYTDYVGPRFGLVALLAALDHRRRTGEGTWLDIAQAEAGMQFLAPYIAQTSVTGEVLRAVGNKDAAMAPHGAYRARNWDSWVAIAVTDDEVWKRLAGILGLDWRDWPDLEARLADALGLDAHITAWTMARSADEAVEALQAAGIPAHVVVDTDAFMADPQLNAREHFVRRPHPLMAESLFEGSRYRLSKTPAQHRRSAPTWGLHNDEVLRGILGYDDAKIAALQAADALG
jgi:crotonobetainyl-CoA:carnitine CoA-transferase CaiB-like acyl-CoA transferase